MKRLAICLVSVAALAVTGCGSSSSETEEESKPVSINASGWPTPPSEVDLGSLQDQPITGVDGCEFRDFSTATQISIICEDARAGMVTIERPKHDPFCESEQEGAVIHCFSSGGVAVETQGGTAERSSDFLIAVIETLSQVSGENEVEAEEAEEASEPAASGIATDDAGDEVLIKVFTGVPGSAESLSNPAIAACGEDISSLGSSPERSATVPVTIEMEVLSSVGVDVAVHLEEVGLVEAEGEVPQGAVQAIWAGEYSEGPECNLSEGGASHWDPDVAQPGTTHTFNTWMIMPETITPNSPASKTTEPLVFQTFVDLAGQRAELGYKPSSRSLVYCDTGFDAGISPVVALNPEVALSRGCGERE